MSAPTVTGSGASVLTIARSVDFAATGLTVVLVVLVLLALAGSASLPETVAVFEIVPLPVVVTVIVTDVLAPLARSPMAQLTLPAVLTQPAEALLKVTPAGTVSEAVTPVAASGPLLVTWRV